MIHEIGFGRGRRATPPSGRKHACQHSLMGVDMTPLRTASAALSVLLLLLTSVHSSASTLFASAFLSFDTGDPSSEPSSVVAVGDLNGDGRLDLAAANSPTKTASVLLGNGDRTFGP